MPPEQQEQVVHRSAAEIEAELASLEVPHIPEETSHSGEVQDPGEPEHDYNSEASRKGWVPKDKYKGDPAKWVDAKTFIDRGERFTKNLQREIEGLKSKIESFEGTKKQFVKFHEEQIAKKDTELREAITALRVQRTQAIREGEDDLAVTLEDRIDLLKGEQTKLKDIPKEQDPAPAASGPNPNDPVLLEWIDDGNQWFHDDPKLRDYAIAIGQELVTGGETLRGRKFLDKVRARMAEEFPRKFAAPANKARPLPTGESGSSGGSSSSSGKSERDLPPADLALMKQFISEGWTTKDKFLKEYFSGNRTHR